MNPSKTEALLLKKNFIIGIRGSGFNNYRYLAYQKFIAEPKTTRSGKRNVCSKAKFSTSH
jgi:hypothetical protein